MALAGRVGKNTGEASGRVCVITLGKGPAGVVGCWLRLVATRGGRGVSSPAACAGSVVARAEPAVSPERPLTRTPGCNVRGLHDD